MENNMFLDEAMNNQVPSVPQLALMPIWDDLSLNPGAEDYSRQNEGFPSDLVSVLLFDDEDGDEEEDMDDEESFNDMDDDFDDDFDDEDDFDEEDEDYEDEDEDYDYEEDVDYDDFDE